MWGLQAQVTGSGALPRSKVSVNREGSWFAKGRYDAGPLPLTPSRGIEVLGPTLFRALSADDAWLGIELGRPVPQGRWVSIRYRLGLTNDPVRPLLRMVRADGVAETEILAGPVCGAARWLMRIPPGIVRLEINPVKAAGPFAFAIDSITIVSRPALLFGALRRKPILALNALALRLRGKGVRARHFIKSIAASDPFSRYASWLAARTAPALPEPDWAADIPITILIDARRGTEAEIARSLASIEQQDPPPACRIVQACVPNAGPPHRRAEVLDADVALAFAAQQPGWVGVVAAGDILAPGALAAFRAHAARNPDLTAIYSDEDVVDHHGRRSAPELKPDWSPRLQAGTGYVGRAVLVQTSAINAPGIDSTGDPLDLFAMAMSAPQAAIGHVRRILYHRAVDAGLDALRVGTPAATAMPLDSAPTVSVIVPNRDRLGLLKPCIEGLRHKTDYPNLSIIIVDNGSVEAATHAYYGTLADDPRVTILMQPGPFNFSALCNAGVAASDGEIVVLLNNDIEVIGPGWLRAIVGEAMRPEVGAVGALLLYPDGRLQHGGVVIGLGGAAGHIHRSRAGDDTGWLGRLAVPHEVSAVTGACIAVSRAKYDAVGGLDEELFPISFNDIDFCLKLRAGGWCNMMVPDAVMYHHESASRGRDHAGAKQARAEREAANFAAKWQDVMRDDPYFHPGLSLLRFNVSLG